MAEPSARLIIDADGDVVRLIGEIDFHTSGELSARLEGFGTAADVIIDMSGVEFIDSSGLRVLVEAYHAHDANSTRLVIRAPSAVVTNLLSISGLSELLHLEPHSDA